MNNFSTMPLRFRVWDKEKRCFVKSLSDFRLYLDACLQYDTTGRLYFAENGRFIISQDTGLKDRNGESIYTGDIVKSWDEINGVVYYDQDLLQVRVKFADADDEDLPSCEAEKIGNIWQTQNY